MSLTGLDICGYEGLDSLIRADFQGPVHIVRQTISNLETGISRICPYHRYEGLSIAPQKARDRKGYTYPYIHNKPSLGDMRICGYKGLKVWDKKVWGFLYSMRGTLLEYNRNQSI